MNKLHEDEGGGVSCGAEGSGGIGDFAPSHLLGTKTVKEKRNDGETKWDAEFQRIFESIHKKPSKSFFKNIAVDMSNDKELMESVILEFLPTASIDKKFWDFERETISNGRSIGRPVTTEDHITITSTDQHFNKQIRLQLIQTREKNKILGTKYFCSVEDLDEKSTVQYSGDWELLRMREEAEDTFENIFREGSGRKDFNALFNDGDRIGMLSFESPYLVLSFDEPFVYSPRKNFVAGDYVAREIFTPKELFGGLQDLGVKELPFEVHGEEKLREIYDFIRE
jgi:hypothetical protein